MKFRLIICSIALLLIPVFTNATSVSPSTISLNGGRGETVTGSITVINTNATDQRYFLGIMPFLPKEETGSPQFLTKKTNDGLVQWIQFTSNQIIIPSISKVEVPFTVIIPQDVSSGGYYAAITVSNAPSDIVETNGAVIEAKMAILVFLTVDGETNEKMELLDFTSSNRFVTNLSSNEFQIRIQNQGNSYIVPKGLIVMKDTFGRTILTKDVNKENSRILPLTTRKFEIKSEKAKYDWKSDLVDQSRLFAIGPIKAHVTLQSESGKSQVQSDMTVWYVPIHLLLLILISITILIIGYRWIEKKKKF